MSNDPSLKVLETKQPDRGRGDATTLQQPSSHREGTGIAADLIGAMFDREVIKKVWGELPSDVRVSIANDRIEIDHTKLFGKEQRQVHFRYEVSFGGEEVTSPQRVNLNGVNKMTMPPPTEGRWTEGELENARNALRRMIIADPTNPRFQKGVVTLAPYQREAVEAIHEDWERSGKALIVKATATGKTVVGFTAVHEYLEKTPAEKGKPFIFLVNNTIILDEAQKKLHEMFPDKYRTSCIYDGVADMSGDIIFATPQSLLTDGRLQTILKKRGVGGLVFDETHHVPATTNKEIYRMVEEHRLQNHTNTKFLGMTATEVRPDRANVIKYFDHITFEYPAEKGKNEGYLAPISYRSVDSDINPGNKRILPGEHGYEQYKEAMYSRERFPHLAAVYKDMCTRTLDDRGLIIAPSVDKCQELVAYLRTAPPAGAGIEAVSLTARDRAENPLYFAHAYQAWKTGAWPEDSPFEKLPVPKVVVGVDIFKEGVDVPAINNLILWADTDSIINYVQTIGRGLRLAPFKTHLEIGDAVGLFRKAPLLPFLGSLIDRPEGKGESEEDRGNKAEEREPEALRPLSVTGTDVTSLINEWYNDISQRLHNRYLVYSEIPVKELLETFDPWLAKKFGFVAETSTGQDDADRGSRQLYNYCNEFAEKLFRGTATPEEKQEFRARSIPAFSDHANQHSGIKEPDKLARAKIDDQLGFHLITYSRIFDLLNRGRSGDELVSADMLKSVYPEFDPLSRVHAEYRAKNLTTTRTSVFNLSPEGMTRQLVEASLTSYPKNVRDTVATISREIEHGDGAISILICEGNYSSERLRGDNTEGFSASRKESGTIDEHLQKQLIEIYLATSRLNGLTADDFNLPPKEFYQKLQALTLVAERLKPQAISTQLRKLVDAYSEAISARNEGMAAKAEQGLLDIIGQPKNADVVRAEHIGDTTLNKLLEYGEKLRSVSGEANPTQHASLVGQYEQFLERAALQWRVPVDGMEGTTVVVSRKDSIDRFSLTIESSSAELSQIGKSAPTPLRIYAETQFLPPHLCLLEDKNGTALDRCSVALPPETRALFFDGVIDALERVACSATDRNAALVIPKGTDSIYEPLVKRIRDTTLLDVLGPIEYDQESQAMRINFSFNEALVKGRYSFLTPEIAPVLKTFTRGGGWTAEKQFAYIYQAMYDFQHRFTPQWGVVEKKIEAFSAGSDKTLETQKAEILYTIRNQAAKDVTGPWRMEAMLTMMEICNHVSPETSVTAQQLSAAHLLMAGRFNLVADRRNRDGLRHCGRLIAEVMKKRDLVEGGLDSLSRELSDDIHAFFREASDEYADRGYVSEETTSVVNSLCERVEAHFAALHQERIATISHDEMPVTVRFGHKFPNYLRPPFVIMDQDGESGLGVFIEPKNGKDPRVVHWDPVCKRLTDPEKVEAVIFNNPNSGIVTERGYLKKNDFVCCKFCRGQNEKTVDGTPHPNLLGELEKTIKKARDGDPLRLQWVEEADE